MKVSRARRFSSKLRLKGNSIRSWALARGYNPKTVYGVLNGRLTGKRGVHSPRIIAEISKELAS